MQVEDNPQQAVSGRAAPGTASNAILQGLLQVPDLATAEDREQAAGIVSLAALLQVRSYLSVMLENGLKFLGQHSTALRMPAFPCGSPEDYVAILLASDDYRQHG